MTVPTVTAPPVPGCLVMTQDPSAWISAIGKPGVAEVGELGEERVVAAGGLGAALEHVPGDGGAGERVEVAGAQPKCAAAGPTTSEASVTRPVTTTSAPASRQAAMPQRAEVGVGGER